MAEESAMSLLSALPLSLRKTRYIPIKTFIDVFVSNLASTMFAPGASLLLEEFHETSSIIGTLTVTIYLLGFATGPLFIAPLSELYGRLYIYHVCNLVFISFTIGCALSKNVAMFVVFRFLTGCAGSAPLTNGGGTVADVIPQEKRGAALAIFAVGPLLGPVIGPVMGGFISQGVGWRWNFWVLAMIVNSPITFPKLVSWAWVANFSSEWHRFDRDADIHERDILACSFETQSTQTFPGAKKPLVGSQGLFTTLASSSFCALHCPSYQDVDALANRLPPFNILRLSVRPHVPPIHNISICFRRTIWFYKRYFRSLLSRTWSWDDFWASPFQCSER